MALERTMTTNLSNLQSSVFPFMLGHQTSVDVEYYDFECSSGMFRIPTRYTNLKLVGQGANGSVCRADDLPTGKTVAIKKFHHPFSSDKQAQMVYRELIMLQHMSHPNIIFMVHAVTPAESAADLHNDLYAVMPFVDTDLSRLTDGPWDEQEAKWIIYQILRGLKYLHSAGIIHRDLKPGNIGITQSTPLRVRILDFGMSRMKSDQMTGYVCTRHYRAPEVFLHWMQYCEKADLWSVGCIMAFMMKGRCLFEGNSYVMTKNIVEILGPPDPEFMQKVQPEAVDFINGLAVCQACGLHKELPNISQEAFDLVSQMLLINPSRRCSVEEALESTFMSAHHHNVLEFTTEALCFPHEESQLTADEYKGLVWKMITESVPKFGKLLDDVD